MQILQAHDGRGLPDAAVLDFDGTISKLRAGWERVMEPLMCENIPGGADEVRSLVRRYIDESTGIQTIFQMRWLAEEIARRGGTPADPWAYKDEYNRRLMAEVSRRRRAVADGTERAADYLVPGARDFLAALRARGVRLYAASGTDEEDVCAEAAVLGVDEYFTEIAGAARATDRCSKEAVLRRLVEHKAEIQWPDESEGARFLSVTYSMPEWLAQRLIDDYGPEEATAARRRRRQGGDRARPRGRRPDAGHCLRRHALLRRRRDR